MVADKWLCRGGGELSFVRRIGGGVGGGAWGLFCGGGDGNVVVALYSATPAILSFVSFERSISTASIRAKDLIRWPQRRWMDNGG
ncbi:hypothetical protein HanIR_Chr10g0461831 [Helianthus annuus]|nr:hypothetical protein HanIR_Chr10g0461831 [Helianthus annuus]